MQIFPFYAEGRLGLYVLSDFIFIRLGIIDWRFLLTIVCTALKCAWLWLRPVCRLVTCYKFAQFTCRVILTLVCCMALIRSRPASLPIRCSPHSRAARRRLIRTWQSKKSPACSKYDHSARFSQHASRAWWFKRGSWMCALHGLGLACARLTVALFLWHHCSCGNSCIVSVASYCVKVLPVAACLLSWSYLL